ncbi:hypothetical protein FA95DRAFT_540396 [Auriscalpium vulgare]|uniref:Uncharacterized protein n=1 Tax=Auriscalpium vulgare TaxID=40419 RepID=A0ACB8RF19_9AGAM|nr:hypothetical protein FA95DRAFT_540396 [Auriscalpium vulgare]
MSYFQSPQEFVRALKAASDPPKPGDPSKIDIARQGWSNSTLHVANKAEIVTEWILTRLLKDRTRDRENNPVLDVRYWQLLTDVVNPSEGSSNGATPTNKAWLRPLVNRVPIAPIVTSLLSLNTQCNADQRVTLLAASLPSLAVLWPLAVPKTTPDTLMECYGAVLHTMASSAIIEAKQKLDVNLVRIGSLVTASLRSAISHSSSKKKMTQSFTQNGLEDWLKSCNHNSFTDSNAELKAELYAAGADLLFNSDTLKKLCDDPSSSPLFTSLQTLVLASPIQVISTLPALLSSFAQATRKYRSSLFPGTSGNALAASVRSAGMKFFASCKEILPQAHNGSGTESWIARLGLLNAVESEGLFGFGQEDAADGLRQDVQLCAQCLQQPTEASNAGLALQCLCSLARIDYELVEPLLPAILFELWSSFPVDFSSASTWASELLSLVLTYHIQTRTIPSFLSLLFDSFTQPSTQSAHVPATRTSYPRIMASPVMSSGPIDKLSRAVAAFVTPGQTLSTAEETIAALQSAWERFDAAQKSAAADRGAGSRKKSRKSITDSTENAKSQDVDASALAFVLTARLAAVVLTALPLHSVTDSAQAAIHLSVRRTFSGVLEDAVATALGPGSAEDGRSAGKRSRDTDSWAVHVVGAAALRFRYVVGRAGNSVLPASEGAEDGQRLGARLVASLSSDAEDVLPELRVEIYRSLLGTSLHHDVDYRESLLDSVLSFLDKWLPKTTVSDTDSVSWSGLVSNLSSSPEGRAFAAIGLLRMLLDRYLPAINVHSSPEQRQRFVEMLFATGCLAQVVPKANPKLTAGGAVMECLRSAVFWEQHNLRTVMFSALNVRTEALDGLDINDARKVQKSSKALSPSQRMDAAEAYAFLLYAPSEYVPKASRADMLKRAVILDFILARAERKGSKPTSDIQALLVVRAFLLRTFVHLGSCDHQMLHEYLQHLISSPLPTTADVGELQQVTYDLMQLHMRTVLRSAEKGDPAPVAKTIATLQMAPLLERDVVSHADEAVLRLMKIAISDFSPASLPQPVASAILTLYEHVLNKLKELVKDLIADADVQAVARALVDRLPILRLWSQCISFASWLQASRRPAHGLGIRLVHALSSTQGPNSPDTTLVVLGILLAELNSAAEGERTPQLGHVLAAYVVFSRSSEHKDRERFDELVVKLFHNLSVSEFSSALELVQETLATGLQSEDANCLVHLASLMLHEAPESTLKIVQTHFTQCLHLFVSQCAAGTVTRTARLQILKFVNAQCSDRPASIRALNMGTIWSLLARQLAGSAVHDPETDASIFHEIISISSALVRLRRDLVIHTLPHLTAVLRQLIAALRRPRANLGAKQARLVADTLPAWVRAGEPLGADEGRALARLLSTLTVKTLVRVHGAAQTPEALAQPMSKHAAYVVLAYVEALNDPLCVLPADVRRELQPGLFVLCGMLNEHARDALMVSALDASGKAAMKVLWREYEKQRYVGRG